jgi:hypothetical protein
MGSLLVVDRPNEGIEIVDPRAFLQRLDAEHDPTLRGAIS